MLRRGNKFPYTLARLLFFYDDFMERIRHKSSDEEDFSENTITGYLKESSNKLSKSVFDYYAGGSGDEITLTRNRKIWEQFSVVPRSFKLNGPPDTTNQVLGTSTSFPVSWGSVTLLFTKG
jgi:hypothetical protein